MSGEGGYRVVVVEDEAPILENLVSKIEASPLSFHVVGTAREGESGLALVLSQEADLLVTDIRMPVMDGLKLAEAATKQRPHLKVLVVSGYDEFAYAQ